MLVVLTYLHKLYQIYHTVSGLNYTPNWSVMRHTLLVDEISSTTYFLRRIAGTFYKIAIVEALISSRAVALVLL